MADGVDRHFSASVDDKNGRICRTGQPPPYGVPAFGRQISGCSDGATVGLKNLVLAQWIILLQWRFTITGQTGASKPTSKTKVLSQ
jgi:hypothetical protein